MIIGICDDNDVYLEVLSEMVWKILSDLTDITDITVHKLAPNRLYSDIQNQTLSYDILITDIDMGDLNGIELVDKINQLNPSCMIIFISNYINYSTRVYDVNHIYFVLKTEADIRLPKALDKALTLYQEQKRSYMTLCYQNVNYTIPYPEIIYIESLGRYLYVHTEKQVYKTIKTLSSVQSELSSTFVRCHKSFFINMDYVYSISRTNCILKAKENIPISRSYSKSFISTYRQYASNRLN